jgi:hypothetical protein
MGKGRRYELDTKNAINRDTKSCVKAHRPDFSGNSAGEVADIMVVWQADRMSPQRPSGHAERHVAYLELKNKDCQAGNRKVMMNGTAERADGTMQSGLEELKDLVYGSPPWSDVYVVFNFQHRAPIVLDAEVLLHWLKREQEGWGKQYVEDGKRNFWPECDLHGIRLTDGDNISVVKPELDYWQSAQAANDNHLEILNAIGVEPYYWEE